MKSTPRIVAPLLIVLMLFASVVLPAQQSSAQTFPGSSWKTRKPTPKAQAALKAFKKLLSSNSHGIVIHEGFAIYQWGTRRYGDWASASKIVFVLGLLFAVQEGRANDIDDLVTTYGWPLNAKDADMTLRHLTNMVSGYTLPDEPGERWAYNDYGINLFGQTVFDVIYGIEPNSPSAIDKLFRSSDRLGPLQFQDGKLFREAKRLFRVNMTPRDFARVGWLLLNKGKWADKQVVNAQLLKDIMQPQVPSGLPASNGTGIDDSLGIGTSGGTNNQTIFRYQGYYGSSLVFNKGLNGKKLWLNVPDDAFHARGHTGQHTLLVIPSLELVMAWNNGPSYLKGDAEHSRTNNIYRKLVQAAHSN